MDVLRQQVDGLDSHGEVLATLDGTDGKDETLGELVTGADIGTALGRDRGGETGGKTLVDDADAVGILRTAQLEDVLAGALADGDDVVGLTEGMAELPLVETGVEPVVVLGVAQEDEVVDGDDAADAGTTETHGELAGEAVVDVDTVADEVADDVARTPQGLA